MIRFITAALIAIVVVGLVSANEDSDNEQETSLLMGDQRQFTSFCVAERKAITADIKSRVDKQSSKVYQLFFNNFFVEIADEVLGVTREDVERFTNSIATPSSVESAPAGPISENELQQRVDDSIDAMMTQVSPNMFGRIRAATFGVVQTMYKTMSSAFFLRLTKLRAMMNKENFLQGFVDACKQVAEYEDKLVEDLEAEKARLAKSVSQPELLEFIQGMDIKSLPCQTPRYISRLDGACNVLIGGTNYFLKMWGVDSTLDFPQPSGQVDAAPAN